jgi:hypothetical protein
MSVGIHSLTSVLIDGSIFFDRGTTFFSAKAGIPQPLPNQHYSICIE